MFNQCPMAPLGFGPQPDFAPPQPVYQASVQPYNSPQMPPYQQYLSEPIVDYSFQDNSIVYGGCPHPFPSQSLVLPPQQQPQCFPQMMCYVNQSPHQYVQQFGQCPSLPAMQWQQPPSLVQVPAFNGNYLGSFQQYDPNARECRTSVFPSQNSSFPRSQSHPQLSPRSYDQHTTTYSSLFPVPSNVQTNTVEDTGQVVKDQQRSNQVIEQGECSEQRISAESEDQQANKGISVADERLDSADPPVAEPQKLMAGSDVRAGSHPTERIQGPQNKDSGQRPYVLDASRQSLPVRGMHNGEDRHRTPNCDLLKKRLCPICEGGAHIEIRCSKFEQRKGFLEDAEKFDRALQKPAFATGHSYRPTLRHDEKQNGNQSSDWRANAVSRSRG